MGSLKNILITGGSGLIGRRLTSLLIEKGYGVSHLGRSRKDTSIKTFIWNPERNQLDKNALRGSDVIIHLAGAGIADKRWNQRVKEEILLSRTHTARLLTDALGKNPHNVKVFISASGISYYGLGNAPDHAFVESDSPADDFMARVTIAWEKEIRDIDDQTIRTVMIRTGVVLARNGGALGKLATPVKYFVGAPLGSGTQYVNWIHIDDLCSIYLKAIEDPDMQGAYNAVAPHPVTNKQLTGEIAKVLNRPLWLPPVPGFVLRLIAGEVAQLVLKGAPISCEKIQRAGFAFKYPTVDGALADLFCQSGTSVTSTDEQ